MSWPRLARAFKPKNLPAVFRLRPKDRPPAPALTKDDVAALQKLMLKPVDSALVARVNKAIREYLSAAGVEAHCLRPISECWRTWLDDIEAATDRLASLLTEKEPPWVPDLKKRWTVLWSLLNLLREARGWRQALSNERRPRLAARTALVSVLASTFKGHGLRFATSDNSRLGRAVTIVLSRAGAPVPTRGALRKLLSAARARSSGQRHKSPSRQHRIVGV